MSETVEVKVEDLRRWAAGSRNYGMISAPKEMESYLPDSEQPVKVFLSELRAMNAADPTHRDQMLRELIARLDASDESE